jgi:hypothetical protein
MSSPGQFLHVAVAQREAEIQPDRVPDNLGREAMAAVAERGHADTLPDTPLTPDPVSVTMPARLPCMSLCAGHPAQPLTFCMLRDGPPITLRTSGLDEENNGHVTCQGGDTQIWC